jgi:hypothetical protein
VDLHEDNILIIIALNLPELLQADLPNSGSAQ